jgi:hypothetical protein
MLVFLLQLAADEIGKLMPAHDFFGEVLRTLDEAQTFGASTMAIKGFFHTPFSRGVKEAELFTCLDVAQGSQDKIRRVEKTVGGTTVVDVFKEQGRQNDVLIIAYLYGIAGGMRQGLCCCKMGNGSTFLKIPERQQSILLIYRVEFYFGKTQACALVIDRFHSTGFDWFRR